MEPGAPDSIKDISYFDVLTVALNNDSEVVAQATLVKSGLLAYFEEDVSLSLPLANVRACIVSRAKSINSPRALGIYQPLHGLCILCPWQLHGPTGQGVAPALSSIRLQTIYVFRQVERSRTQTHSIFAPCLHDLGHAGTSRPSLFRRCCRF